jgi:predicted RNA polymerase sigma factor
MQKFIFLIVLTVAGFGAFAQDSNTMYLKQDTSAKAYSMNDYIAMRGMTMMVFKKGDSLAMTNVMTLQDGSVVKQDGTVTRKKGQTIKLKDGDKIYWNGKVVMKGEMVMNKKGSLR